MAQPQTATVDNAPDYPRPPGVGWRRDLDEPDPTDPLEVDPDRVLDEDVVSNYLVV